MLLSFQPADQRPAGFTPLDVSALHCCSKVKSSVMWNKFLLWEKRSEFTHALIYNMLSFSALIYKMLAQLSPCRAPRYNYFQSQIGPAQHISLSAVGPGLLRQVPVRPPKLKCFLRPDHFSHLGLSFNIFIVATSLGGSLKKG